MWQPEMRQTYPRISRQAWWRWLHGCGFPPRPEPCFAWLSGRSHPWHISWFCPGSLPGSPAVCSLHWIETKPVRYWLHHHLTSYPLSKCVTMAHLQPRWRDGRPLRESFLTAGSSSLKPSQPPRSGLLWAWKYWESKHLITVKAQSVFPARLCKTAYLQYRHVCRVSEIVRMKSCIV